MAARAVRLGPGPVTVPAVIERLRIGPRLRLTLLALALVVTGWAGSASLFTVDVTDYGVVSRFGRIVRVIDRPGLGWKLPFDFVQRLDKRLLHVKPAPVEYLTADKKNIVVQSLVTWRIADPARYLAAVGTRAAAEQRLRDVVIGEIGAVLGRQPFSSFVSAAAGDGRFQAMLAEMRAQAQAFMRPAYGIELVDVKIRQLLLPEDNKTYVFQRMKAERGRIAMQYRSEGEQDAKRIIAVADRDKVRITAEAYDQAQRIEAAGEAEAMRTYADAYGQDRAFYTFLRTLRAYGSVLDDQTTMFLPADAELFELLGQSPGAEAQR